MDNHEARPPFHQRIGTRDIRHIINVLKQLCGGSIGFDTSRNEETATKDKLVAYILARYTPAEIDAAHAAVVATYGGGHEKRGKRGWRRNGQANGHNGASAGAGHAHGAQSHEHSEQFSVPPPPAYVPPPPPAYVPPPAGNDDRFAALARMLAEIMGKPQVDASEVARIADERIAAADLPGQIGAAVDALKLEGFARTLKLERRELPPIDCGVQHVRFSVLLQTCAARMRNGNRLNVWCWGGAGCGKSTAAEKVAEVLGLAFYGTGSVLLSSDLLGYRNHAGEIVRTQFREAFEHGGIFVIEEVENNGPGANMALQSALANGWCAFPDRIVRRHPDCVIIAGANTTGLGPTSEYVGRQKQDAAFLNRFVYLRWPLDEALEDHLCGDKAWLRRVRHVRANVAARGVKGAMITPRASMFGEALLAAGLSQEDVEEMTLRQGMTNEQWEQVR
jgi:hypothetical protein